jgi:hypothetical protein
VKLPSPGLAVEIEVIVVTTPEKWVATMEVGGSGTGDFTNGQPHPIWAAGAPCRVGAGAARGRRGCSYSAVAWAVAGAGSVLRVLLRGVGLVAAADPRPPGEGRTRREPPDEAPTAGADIAGGCAHQRSRAPSSTRLARRTS